MWPHYIVKDLVDRVKIKRPGWQYGYRVQMYGHTYEWGVEENTFEQVLLKDGVEFCRTSGWDSGLPCVFAPNFNDIAGTNERSRTVAASLCGEKSQTGGE